MCSNFNLNLLQANEDDWTDTFLDSIITNGFIPKIALPTRYSLQHCSSSLIDNVLIKSIDNIVFSAHLLTHNMISDHFACFVSVEISCNSMKPSSAYISLTNHSASNLEIFRRKIELANLEE